MSDEGNLSIEPCLDAVAFLGECPNYITENNTVLFVDGIGLNGRKAGIFRYDLASKKLEKREVPSTMCTAAMHTDKEDVFVAGLGKKICKVPWSGDIVELAEVEKDREIPTRINDCKTDRKGRLWFGTMGSEWLEEEQTVAHGGQGSIYCADLSTKTATVTSYDSGFDIANGMDWSLDNRTMFVADSGPKQIYAYDYDETTGAISNRRVAIDFRWVKIRIFMGAPDGITIDSRGHLWVACFGAGWVACFDPETGNLLDRIAVPNSAVTSCCFGGPNLNQMFITTANKDQNAEEAHTLYRVDGFQSHGLPSCPVKLY